MTRRARARPLRSSRPRRSPKPSKARRERGLALVVVLWTVTILAVIAASFSQSTRTGTKIARNALDNAQARALAEAGINRAVLSLFDADPERRWPTDGSPVRFAYGGGEIEVSIQDEAGKVDLNSARERLLTGLFEALELPPESRRRLFDRIADFRDGDDEPRPEGAEDEDYRAAGLSLESKDAPFERSDEIEQVLGIDPQNARKLLPLVTAYSGLPGIDPESAPREALLAIPDVKRAEVEALLEARAEPQAGDGLRALPTLGGVGSYLAESPQTHFTIRADARTANGARFVREALVWLKRSPGQLFQFLSWRQGDLPVSNDDGAGEPSE